MIAMAPMRRKNRIERIPRSLGDRCELPPAPDQGICGQNSGAAGVCENREPRTFWPRLFAESLRHVKDVGNVLHAKNAASAKRCVINFVGSRQGAGMRCRRRGSSF